MQKRFYVDTAIRRDYFEDRKDSIRPLGEFAFQFLKCCGAEGCLVLYSEFVVYELRKDYSEEEINLVFSSFMDFLVEVPISPAQHSEAGRLAGQRTGSHKTDILHAILARDNKAVLITRDAHFDCLRDIVEIIAPEEITFG